MDNKQAILGFTEFFKGITGNQNLEIPSEIAEKCGIQAQAEKTCDIEKSNFDMRQYKLDTDTAYECGYNAGLKAQADGEYISREAVIDIIEDVCPIYGNDYRYILREKINELPSVAIPNKTGEWLFKEVTEDYHVTGQCSKCKERRRIDNYCSNCGSYNGD